jgi:chromosomal replication initiation ATPase DnaA
LAVDEIIKRLEKDSGVAFEKIMSKNQVRQTVKARAMYYYLAKERCTMNGAQ